MTSREQASVPLFSGQTSQFPPGNATREHFPATNNHEKSYGFSVWEFGSAVSLLSIIEF
jgi:hypothetical protein